MTDEQLEQQRRLYEAAYEAKAKALGYDFYSAVMVRAALSPENQRITPVEPLLAPEHPMAATPSEDGREVPEVVAFRHQRSGDAATAETVRVMGFGLGSGGYTEPLMAIAQHSRIVAAKDAEIARLWDDRKKDAALIHELSARPARQVGGDEREARALFEDMALIADDEKCIQILAAALAPAAVAVVMPEPFAWAEFDGEGGYDLRLYEENETFHADYIAKNGEKYRDWVWPLLRADEVARLNRRAIPVEVLRLICADWENGEDVTDYRANAIYELSALLGKDGEVGNG